MGKLIYLTNTSVDGYIEDEDGRFDWTEPDDALFAFITDLMRPIGTHLYGRRLYETMAVWETDPEFAQSESELATDFSRVWQQADKVVYSTTLDAVPTARTRVERSFEPGAVSAIKDAAATDLFLGGAEIAGVAFEAGLVDEYHLLVRPVVVGGGKPALPPGTRARLALLEAREVSGGVGYLRYRVVT
jgi:dihydrofolate reductase